MPDEAAMTGAASVASTSTITTGWLALRDNVRAQEPALSAPAPDVAGLCVVCRGPSGSRVSRCYQCELHRQCAQDGMADVTVPVAFAVKGGQHATNLWLYKSSRSGPAASASAAALRALLLVFLRDHRSCICRSANIAGPTHLAVVPTARGRLGQHPLRALIAPYLSGPWAELTAAPGDRERDLDPARFVAAPVPGGRVLLVDDTWTTGASAQSAAMALRRAGAAAVVTVVLGRHVASTGSGGAIGRIGAPFSQRSCAVHNDV